MELHFKITQLNRTITCSLTSSLRLQIYRNTLAHKQLRICVHGWCWYVFYVLTSSTNNSFLFSLLLHFCWCWNTIFHSNANIKFKYHTQPELAVNIFRECSWHECRFDHLGTSRIFHIHGTAVWDFFRHIPWSCFQSTTVEVNLVSSLSQIKCPKRTFV